MADGRWPAPNAINKACSRRFLCVFDFEFESDYGEAKCGGHIPRPELQELMYQEMLEFRTIDDDGDDEMDDFVTPREHDSKMSDSK